jgi:hypothetical protein
MRSMKMRGIERGERRIGMSSRPSWRKGGESNGFFVWLAALWMLFGIHSGLLFERSVDYSAI